ncbi:HAMP domain-containing protein [Parashewanella curva]|uniref:histidine kinase n=1 Tax=Parashewanella curva TaxID=2338552 RepID=A0A3L8PZC6_9GAMM|nr:ATP-binding protein [Parashewanella curva]RLV60665.1 HAMP domain-containing protein [Parashewanella curva]
MRRLLYLKLPKFSLRTKFLVIVLFLSALPWFGYRYFNELDVYLKQTQLHNLSNTSQAVATALQQRPKLFERLNFSRDKIQPKDFYLYPLSNPVHFTGSTDDLPLKQSPAKIFSSHNSSSQAIIQVGQYENQVFMSFHITVPNLDLNHSSHSPYASQYLQISTVKDHRFNRYLITISASGKLNGFLLPDDPAMMTPLTPESVIEGMWTLTNDGILLQLTLPKGLLGEAMAFESFFHTIHGTTSITSSPVNSPLTLGRLIEPSSDIEQIIDSLDNSDSRIWVLNHAGQVLAQGGDIHASGQSWSSGVSTISSVPDILKPIYHWLIGTQNLSFVDPNQQQIQFDDPMTHRALSGFKGQSETALADSDTELLSSITPIWHQGVVVGAVLTQQTTQGIQELRSHAMTSLLNTALIVTILASVSMLIFATSISRRITQLRDQAESVIDSDGKIHAIDINSQNADEIGDLIRSFSSMLTRVEHYNHYLENMSSRLSHELRTPITIVRSSLEHLELQQGSENDSKYLLRAQEGLQRLNGILNSMSEATRIEQTIDSEPRSSVNLSQLVNNCFDIYQQIYPEHQFHAEIQADIHILGVEDYLAQMFDKVIANAAEFSKPNEPIIIQLIKEKQQAELSITNTGPMLPEGMESEIFNSMVSIREHENKQKPHLGLGLYISSIISRFHYGNIQAKSCSKNHTTTISANFPLLTPNGEQDERKPTNHSPKFDRL